MRQTTINNDHGVAMAQKNMDDGTDVEPDFDDDEDDDDGGEDNPP